MNDPTLIGRAKELEIASLFISNGLYVFYPLVDKGFDLVVTNAECSSIFPVQVKFRASHMALELSKKDVLRYKEKNVILAYIIGKNENKKTWIIPFNDWKKQSSGENRNDGKRYITISKNKEFLIEYEGVKGINLIKKMLGSNY